MTIGEAAVSGAIPVPATGGPGQWSDLLVDGLELEAGVQTLRLDAVAGGFDLDRLTINRALPPPDPENELALQERRFRVTVVWRTEEGTTSAGRPVRMTPDTGVFWFFDPANAEILVKIVDACGLAGFENFWVFSAALTSVEYDLSILDSRTGQTYLVHNPQGLEAPPVLSTDTLFRDCGQDAPGELPRRQTIDTASLPPAPTPQIISTQSPELVGPCLEDATTICLNGGRFRVTATWRTAAGGSGPASMQTLADDSGYGTFFDPANVELFLKVLDACELAPFHRFWPFLTGLTSVAVDLSIVDAQTGKRYRVQSPEGSVFPTVFATDSFFVDCPSEVREPRTSRSES